MSKKELAIDFLLCIKDFFFSDVLNMATVDIEQIKDKYGEIVGTKEEKRKDEFVEKLMIIKEMINEDVEFALEVDPASNSREEVILTYPGIFAILTYRIANILYKEKVQLFPRIISEYAHSLTGIDIHPGAEIGRRFFIDHGTGVVIGETAIIGDEVKIYQGVTLGAKSLREGYKLKNTKRHPTIKNNVTIYSNASILGGNTIIGNNVIVGSNTFITSSIDDDILVLNKSLELIYKENKNG